MAENLKLAKALREAKSFFQGASNAAASNVSAPVDAIAWALRKAGVPVGDAPMGGSDWMRQHGLTAEAPGASGLIGESVGGVAPIVASAKAAQIAKGLLQAGENLAAPATMNPQAGAIVFHGSPHKFEAFDSSKIGTGEGAQAYGHGLYLAEDPRVAQSYKDALTPNTGTWDATSNKQSLYDAAANHGTTGYASAFAQKYFDLVKGGKSDNQAKRQLLSQLQKRIAAAKTPGDVQGSQEALQFLQNAKINMPEGSLYKVDLPDEAIAKMLDWDKPLSQQHPNTALALEAIRESAAKSFPNIATGDPTGKGIYAAYQAHRGGNATAASDRLRELGIPGIRYLDGGSRGTGTGTSNYVVFPGNENLLRILERNNQPLGTK